MEAQWVYVSRPFNDKEKAHLMGAMIKVGTDALFKLHTYQYCGELYGQGNGGPTGLRYTGLAAKCRMIRWARKLIRKLKMMGIKVLMIFFYVDDVRIICHALRPEVKFCQDCKSLHNSGERPETDVSQVSLLQLRSETKT